MLIRAAVLERFAEPLEVQEVELAAPRRGEVLVGLRACGICHTDMYSASGVDPSGYVPCVLGHEGRGVVEAVGEGVTSVVVGDHVVTLFSPQCGECVNCRSGKTNICVAIREQQNQGYLPDGTTRLSRDGEELRHFMGCSTFAEATVMPEIALAKVSPEAPPEGRVPVRLRPVDGPGRGDVPARRSSPAARASSSGAGMVGLGAVAGCRPAGRRAHRLRRFERGAPGARAPPRRDGHVDGGRRRRSTACSRRPAAYGADFTFEATGLVGVMRQAVESARMGWGVCCVHRRRRQGRDPGHRAALSHHRAQADGRVVRRRQGARPGAGARRPATWPVDIDGRLVHLAPDGARRRQPRLRPHAPPGRPSGA